MKLKLNLYIQKKKTKIDKKEPVQTKKEKKNVCRKR